jgi:hypothetical protein
MSAPKIRVGTPCYGGVITTDYMTSIIELMQYSAENGFSVHIDLLGADSLITRARNTLLARFLASKDATHFMFIDADIGFKPMLVHRMLTFDEDVVAGMYPLKTLRWDTSPRFREHEALETATLQYVGKFCEGDEFERRGPFATGRYCGTGFMLMKRQAIERLVEAHPETSYDADHIYAPAGSKQPSYALFECMIDPASRTYLSEDYGFCQRWRQLGGKIWLDAEGSLAHTGPHHFVDRPDLRFPAERPVEAVGRHGGE